MRSRTLRDQSGFTLVELMVAMSIFLLILVGIFQVFDPSSKAYSTTERKVNVQQGGRVAMDAMSRQIRMAGYFPENIDANNGNDILTPSVQVATESALAVAGDLDGTGATNVFTFCLSNAGLWRVRGPIGVAASYTCPSGNNADLLAENVTGLSFAYFDANNNPVPNPPTGPYSLDGEGLAAVPTFATTTARVSVRRVVIAVTARENVPGQPAQTFNLTSDVRLRNP
jgi:prepilin-type N-terminal cleavage/methylation domain-containing protein